MNLPLLRRSSNATRTRSLHRPGVRVRPAGNRHRRSLLAAALLSATCWVAAPTPGHAQATATFQSVYSFTGGAASESPLGALVQGTDGNFYSTASGVNATDFGSVFRLTPTGALTTLYKFTGGADGSQPQTGLAQGNDGNFYGTTVYGGASGVGTVFKVTPSGALTTLHTFATTDGSEPEGGLLQGSDGNFYGTTAYGGTHGDGTVYRITPAGVLTTLFNFNGENGTKVTAGLVEGSDGNFYGVAAAGGGTGYGTVFSITPAGTLTTLHIFSANDGSDPIARLLPASDGNFYGATAGDEGVTNYGTLFRITPAGVLTTLYSFTGGSDGEEPAGPLVEGSDGNFYGTTFGGGANSLGTVFQLTPAGTLTTLHSFSGGDGSYPAAGLLQAVNGSFYGTTYLGGVASDGTVFAFSIAGIPGRPTFFTGEMPLANGVYYLVFPTGNYFGYYAFLPGANYIYHFDLGYEYCFDAADGENGVYFYDFKSNDFFYTSPVFPFPYLYDFGLASVVYYYPDPTQPGRYDTNGNRFFYVFSTGEIISK